MESKEIEMDSLSTKKIPKKGSKIHVILFLPLIVIMSGDLGVLLANQLLIIVNLNLTPSEIGIVVGFQYLIQGTFTFIFGYLSDKFSRKWLLVFGGSIWVLGSLLTSISWSLQSLLIFRIIAALGLGVQAPVTFSMLSDMFPSESRSNAFAWWGIANLIGSAAAGGIGLSFNQIPSEALDGSKFPSLASQLQYLQDEYFELCNLWRSPYLLLAIIGVVLVGLVLLVREPKRASKEKELEEILLDDEIDYSKQYKIRKEDIAFLWKRRTNIFMVLNFFDNISSGVLVGYLTLYISGEMRLALNFSNISIELIMLLIGIIIGLAIALWGQFYFSKLGDKKYRNGDLRGRIKIMVYSALFQIPFLLVAFLITPTFGSQKSIFLGTVQPDDITFWFAFYMMFILLGCGLAGSFGGTPNWYASMVDGNLPEQRGTMIAIATLMDTIGRAVGLFIGAVFFDLFFYSTWPVAQNYPITLMLIMIGLIFGIISAVMAFPSLYTCTKDFSEVQAILKERAAELGKLKDDTNKK